MKPDIHDPVELEAYIGNAINLLTPEEQETIDNDFTYHPPTAEQIKKYPLIREEAKQLCVLLYRLAPGSPERTLAKRALEQFVFWANASIAREKDV